MRQQNFQPPSDFVLLRRPHAFHLVHQIVQIEIAETALTQQPRLLLRPGEEVALIEAVRSRFGCAVGHCTLFELTILWEELEVEYCLLIEWTFRRENPE